MDLMGNWNSLFSQMTWRQVDSSVSTAEIGDMIEFANPLSGLSLWGVYVGDGRVIHFGVGDENMTQRACRSFLQQMVPKSKGDRVLRKTRICTQLITEIKVPLGTRIRVNNKKHNLVPSPQEMMQNRCETFLHQEFNYDLLNFNSEHFATFVRYGNAVCNQGWYLRLFHRLVNNMSGRKSKVWDHLEKVKDEPKIPFQKQNGDTTQTLQMIMTQRMETET